MSLSLLRRSQLTLAAGAAARPRFSHKLIGCTYHTTRPTCAERLQKISSVRRTRKQFSELPGITVAADGSPIVPLGEWVGGLANTAPKKSRRPSDQLGKENVTRSNDVPPSENAEPSERTDRVKRTRLKNLDSGEVRTVAGRKLPKSTELNTGLPNTPLANEILDNLAKLPHCLLLTRVGSFYESYFDQAVEIARLLNIKLTSKSWGGSRVPMCGFPIMHLNKYLKVLVQDNRRFVAMCEEFMRSRAVGPRGGFDRRVTRIITPGTLIDEPFLNHYENNYLLAVSGDLPGGIQGAADQSILGLAWIDISTGDFFTKRIPYDTLRDELVRIDPKEVVLCNVTQGGFGGYLRDIIAEENYFASTFHFSSEANEVIPTNNVPQHADDVLATGSSEAMSSLETDAVSLLMAYLRSNLREHNIHLSSPNREPISRRMQMDSHTVKGLEIKESMREGGTTGCLLSVVKRTVTSGGTRLLARWICSPSTSLEEINARQSLVALFRSRLHLQLDLIQCFGQLEDATRIVQRFILGRGDFADLTAVCNTIDTWNAIKRRLEVERLENTANDDSEAGWNTLSSLLAKYADLSSLNARIRSAITSVEVDEDLDLNDPPSVEHAGFGMSSGYVKLSPATFKWKIRPEFSQDLERLHRDLAASLAHKDALEKKLQVEYSAPSLTLRNSPSQGMHVHLARARRDDHKIKSDSSLIPLTKSGTTSTYFLQEWTQLATHIVDLFLTIQDAEKRAFEELRDTVRAYTDDIRRNSRIMDELDVTLAYARLAQDMNLVRPELTDDLSYDVVNGRHPTVELGLLANSRAFVPNTVSFAPDSSLHIITGPNMAGKSTLLRQTALIAILAQTGSFVPADSAKIGIVDKIFSRIGAKDDLYRNRSTFMVEMLETADILSRATPRSLVIMDEVGRGTTVQDGLAIAFATVHHLLAKNGCRTLFATHFHELADMLGCTEDGRGNGVFRGVSFFCTDIDEMEDGYFAYSHRLQPGVNRNSHGLRVAQLAGMPAAAVTVAEEALRWLHNKQARSRDDDRSALKILGQSLASK